MDNLKKDILTVVRLMRLKPTGLLGLRGRSYEDIQEAVSTMIHDGDIVFTSEQYLEIPAGLTWDQLGLSITGL